MRPGRSDEVMFASLIIRLFQLVFSARTVFSLTTNQPEQCFGLFFQRSERGEYCSSLGATEFACKKVELLEWIWVLEFG